MRRGPDLEDKHQFVLGAVEASHPAIGLVPYAKILKLRKRCSARRQELAHMAPVHADEGDCPVATPFGRGSQRLGQECGEARRRHFTDAHSKLTMPDSS